MRQTYRKRVVDDLAITECEVQAPFYGLAAALVYTVYSWEGYFGFRIEFKPQLKDPNAIGGVAYDGLVKIRDGSGGHFRYIEQKITAHGIVAEGQGFIPMEEANEAIGREITRNIIRTHEAVMSYVREAVLFCFAPTLIGSCCETIDQRYGKETEKTARTLLAGINWKMMFESIRAPQEIKDGMDYMLTHSQPSYYSLLSEGYPDAIDLTRDFTGVWGRAANMGRDIGETKRMAMERLADIKAASLLRVVCGDKLFDEFSRTGHISVENNGWKFVISPRYYVHCTDPKGKSADLCIHTVNLSCHPVDEMVIAYLYIKNRLAEYLATAIPHKRDAGFSLAEFKNPYEGEAA